MMMMMMMMMIDLKLERLACHFVKHLYIAYSHRQWAQKGGIRGVPLSSETSLKPWLCKKNTEDSIDLGDDSTCRNLQTADIILGP